MRARALLTLPGVPPLASIAFLLAVWQATSLALAQNSFPPPTEALRALPELFRDRETYTNLAASLARMATGFALGLTIAVPVGLVMGRSQRVTSFLNPILTVIYPIPKAALMPIIMLWVGVGDISKILVIFLGVSLPLVYHSYQGARAVDEKLIWSAMAMGTGPAARVLRVILPSALPEVLLGCRVGLAMALIVMITSEMIARQSGVGNILFNSLDMALYDNVYAMIVVLAALGFAPRPGLRAAAAPAYVLGRDAGRGVGGRMSRALKSTLSNSYSLILLLGVWELICRTGLAQAQLLPAPSIVFARLAQQLLDLQFLHHLAQTVLRLGAGLTIATALGVGLGLTAATWRLGGRLLEPLMRVLAPIPKIALYPALILILGFDHASKIALVAADALFPILFATYYGGRMVERKLIWSARAAGTSRAGCAFKVVLPAALPSVLTGFRIALVISCVVVFLAEMISSADGLGHLLIRAARSFKTVDMFVPLVTISLLGLGLDALVALARRRLLVGYAEERR